MVCLLLGAESYLPIAEGLGFKSPVLGLELMQEVGYSRKMDLRFPQCSVQWAVPTIRAVGTQGKE